MRISECSRPKYALVIKIRPTFAFYGFTAPFLPGYMNIPGWMYPAIRESHKMWDYIKKVDDITWVATMAPNISDNGGLTNNYKVPYSIS